jgi:hypothetical protein
VEASTRVRRGLSQAYMVGASAPRRVRPGQRIVVRLRVRRVRGPRQTIAVRLRVPSSVRPGRRTLTLTGTPDDDSAQLEEELSDEFSDPGSGGAVGGPGTRSIEELRAQVAAIGRFDGVTARISGTGPRAVFRDRNLRVSGKLRIGLRVAGRRR